MKTNSLTPAAAGFSQPAEWAQHKACWLAWPAADHLWLENFDSAQSEFIGLCEAIADVDVDTGVARGESLSILVYDEKAREQAEAALGHLPVEFFEIPYGDIWLRDTAPIFLTNAAGELASSRFQFNGWGEKYDLPHDRDVARAVAQVAKVREFAADFILEGGSVDVDGEGTCLTSRQCLLNPNRNPDLDQAGIEKALCEGLGIQKVLWVGDGLINDHTDGHIDTIARFVAPGVVVCMQTSDKDDPNYEILEQIARDLGQMTDAQGRRLQVKRMTSPGQVLDEDGELMAASYVNFYIGNSTVVVPTYGTSYDAVAIRQIAELFPDRRVIGSSARAILSGGGAFHCLTQQVPKGSFKDE